MDNMNNNSCKCKKAHDNDNRMENCGGQKKNMRKKCDCK